MAQDPTLRILVKFRITVRADVVGERRLMNRRRRLRRRCQSNSSPPSRSRRTATMSGRRQPNSSLVSSTWMTLTTIGSASGVAHTTSWASPSRLTTVRFLGTFLAEPTDVPPNAVAYVAATATAPQDSLLQRGLVAHNEHHLLVTTLAFLQLMCLADLADLPALPNS